MGTWEFAINTKVHPLNTSGQEVGDVIACVPSPWEWGRKEVKQFLIITIDGLTEEEAREMCSIWYEGDLSGKDVEDMEDRPKMKRKRKYQIPLDVLKDGWLTKLDLKKAADMEDNYQPFKEAKIVIDAKEKVALCKDKVSGKYKFQARKVAE